MANVRVPMLDALGVPLRNLVADRTAMFLRLLGELRPDLKGAAIEIAEELETGKTLFVAPEDGQLLVTMTADEYRAIWGELPEPVRMDFVEDESNG